MKTVIQIALSVSLLFAGAAAHPGQPSPRDRSSPEDRSVCCERLLEQERLDEVLLLVEGELKNGCSDGRLLEMASDAALGLDEKDGALAYAMMARDISATDHPDIARRMSRRIGELDPLDPERVGALDDATARLFALAKGAARRRLYVNAVDLFERCRGTRFEGQATKELQRLYGNRSAVKALLESGVDVPLALESFLIEPPPLATGAQPSLGNGWTVKTDNYTVMTNISHRMAKSVARAMEQMNRYYREVYQHKLTGGGTARCTIRIYATRADFDRCEGVHSPSVRGFYSPLKNLVVTYDPRSDGYPFEKIWRTLFHEASHQFTRMTSTGTIPGWLNEGTATYFEGACIQPNGRVAANLVPEHRLRALVSTLKYGRPSLREVISYFEPGSYNGSYYPVGWGLVYFLHNYEDENSNRIYLPLYRRYAKTYRSGGKHDSVARFEQYFIRKAKQTDVKSLADFEKRFKQWILDLDRMESGHHSTGVLLVERARVQRDNGKLERAVETYAWALRNDPESVTALLEQAEVLVRLKQKDVAIYNYRRVLTLSRGDRSTWLPEEQQLCDPALLVKGIGRLDSTLGRELPTFLDQISSETTELAGAYAEAGYPRVAQTLIDRALLLVGEDAALVELAASIG